MRVLHQCYTGDAGSTADLRSEWEAGAFQLERLQAAPECVQAEQSIQAQRQAPAWSLPFTPTPTPDDKLQVSCAPAMSTALQLQLH